MGCRKLQGSIFKLAMVIVVFAILVLITGESSAGDAVEANSEAFIQSLP